MDLFRDERLRMRYTQKDLGELIGKGQQYISEIENGHLIPRFRDADALATLLGVPVEKIFHYYVRTSPLPGFKDLMYLYSIGYDIRPYEVTSF